MFCIRVETPDIKMFVPSRQAEKDNVRHEVSHLERELKTTDMENRNLKVASNVLSAC